MHTDPGRGSDEAASEGCGCADTRVSCLSPELAGWGSSAACALSAAQVCGFLAQPVAGASAHPGPAAAPPPWGPARVPGGARPAAALGQGAGDGAGGHRAPGC